MKRHGMSDFIVGAANILLLVVRLPYYAYLVARDRVRAWRRHQ